MASIAKRKQQVNELRKAHFPFGFQNNSNAESQYIERYKQYEIAMKGKPDANARKNNFQIGEGNTNYTSEFKDRYPEHEIGNREDPKKLKQSHANKNFVFGYDGNNFDTKYNDDFVNKNVQNQRVVPVNQREPHISLGDSLTECTTTYNQTHDKKQGQRVNPGDPNLIRKSNMILGNDNNNFQTQHNATYTKKPIDNYHSSQRSNISSINLGTEGNSYVSQNRLNFAHKNSDAKPVDKNRVLDFRSAHFKFGFPDKNEFQSEAKAQYGQKALDYKKANGDRSSHFDLNVDGKNYFDSMYKQDYDQKNPDKQEAFKNGRLANVLLGTDKDPDMFLTEAKSQFGLKNGQKSSKIKPQPSLDIGTGEGSYLTHNQDIYQNRFNQRQNNRLSNDQINRLKKMNYAPGFQNSTYNLSSENYGKGSAIDNQLSKQMLDSMKNTNIVPGSDNPFKGGTTYKASYLYKRNDDY